VFDIGLSARITGEISHSMFIAGLTYSIADLYHRPTKLSGKSIF